MVIPEGEERTGTEPGEAAPWAPHFSIPHWCIGEQEQAVPSSSQRTDELQDLLDPKQLYLSRYSLSRTCPLPEERTGHHPDTTRNIWSLQTHQVKFLFVWKAGKRLSVKIRSFQTKKIS